MKVAARKEHGEHNRKRRQVGNISALEDMSINTTRLYGMMPEDFNKPSAHGMMICWTTQLMKGKNTNVLQSLEQYFI